MSKRLVMYKGGTNSFLVLSVLEYNKQNTRDHSSKFDNCVRQDARRSFVCRVALSFEQSLVPARPGRFLAVAYGTAFTSSSRHCCARERTQLDATRRFT